MCRLNLTLEIVQVVTTPGATPAVFRFNTMNLTNGKSLIIMLAILVGLIGTFFAVGHYVVSSSKQKTLEKSGALMADMWKDFDFESTTLAEYEALSQSLDAHTRAQQQVRLGFVQSVSGDYQTGILQIKRVIADESVSAETRALAVGYLHLAHPAGDHMGALQFIFKDDGIYKEALGEGTLESMPDLEKGMNGLFKMADSWYETSFIKYMLASQADNELLDNKTLSPEQKKAHITATAEYLLAGDALRRSEIVQSDFRRSLYESLSTLGLHYRLCVLAMLARFDPNYQSQVDAAYQQLMQLYGLHKDNGGFLSIEGYSRFYYAAYLADVFGAARATEIKEIMAPTFDKDGLQGKANDFGTESFYIYELSRHKNMHGSPSDMGHNARFILSIAKVDPTFNVFLVSKGLK